MKKKTPITIYLNRHGVKPLWKGQAICREKGNVSYPIAFIKKAKHATDKEYWDVLNFLFKADV
jgi:hypothetical protein